MTEDLYFPEDFRGILREVKAVLRKSESFEKIYSRKTPDDKMFAYTLGDFLAKAGYFVFFRENGRFTMVVSKQKKLEGAVQNA